jgi:hypothetical protein
MARTRTSTLRARRPSRATHIQELVRGDLRALAIPPHERHASKPAISPLEAAKADDQPGRLGQYLCDHYLIGADDLAAALAEQRQRIGAGRPIALGDLLVEQGHLTVQQLVNMLMLQHLDRVRQTEPARSPQLGELLVQMGLISVQQLAVVLTVQTEARQRGEAVRLGKILIAMKLLTRHELARALWCQRRIHRR